MRVHLNWISRTVLATLVLSFALLSAGPAAGGPPLKFNDGISCTNNTKCLSGNCGTDGYCHCGSSGDSVQNDGETDVDCGGGTCTQKCANGKSCVTHGDCSSLYCAAGSCQPMPTCTDSVKNGSETDVDCGGGTCPTCPVGRACTGNSDCVSANCSGGVCGALAAGCADGIKNGVETDIDCGGGSCPPCTLGKTCAVTGDCVLPNCDSTICKLPPGYCRPYTTVPTSFDAGSLIIPVNISNGAAPDDNDAIHAVGLIWHLLQHGIRIAQAIDTSKASKGAIDFTATATPLQYSAGAVVAGTSASIPYKAGPYIIPAEDAAAAMALMLDGTLPLSDPLVRFGWKHVTTFQSVKVHRADAAFVAPIYRMSSRPPKPLAIYKDGAWLAGTLDKAGLNFSGAGRTPATSAEIPRVYDVITETHFGDGTFSASRYQVLWVVDTYASDVAAGTVTTSHAQTIKDFVLAGGGIVSAGWGTMGLECMGCASSTKGGNTYPDCTKTCGSVPPTRLMSGSGMSDPTSGAGSGTAPLEPGNPWTQIGDSEYHALATDPKTLVPVGGFVNTCARQIVNNDKGEPIILLRDEIGKGPVIYAAGDSYDNGGAWHKEAMQRTVVNTLFNAGGTAEEENPRSYEATRSTPLVIEHTKTTTPQVMMIQGSYILPAPINNTVFSPARPTDWKFPAHRGHMRVIDVSTMGTSDALVRFPDLGTYIWWDGYTAIPSTRNIYTALGSGVLSRATFDKATIPVRDAIKAASGYSASGDADRLMDRIRAGEFGGTDRATPALIPQSGVIEFATGSERSTVLYAATLDGMLHAFKVLDIEVPTTPYSVTDWGSSALTELWAFVPHNQFGLFKGNNQGLQGSPAVADVYGDILDDTTGAPGQDGTKEWVTMLVQTAGDSGKGVYAIDVSVPDLGGACPVGRTACIKGPNPLWVKTDPGMGGAYGAAIAPIDTGGNTAHHIFVATNDATATTGQGGLRIYALKADDGSITWSKFIQYTLSKPSQSFEPNDIPPNVAVVDKTGGNTTVTHLYAADLEGKVWELAADDGTIQNSGSPIYNPGGTEATYPIVAPPALYRDSANDHLHVVVATGGAYWAPSNSSVQQRLVDIDATAKTSAILSTFAAGERVFAAPVVSNEDVYVIASKGLVDLIETLSSPDAAGTAYRVNLKGGPTQSWGISMSGSSVGVSSQNRVVISTADKSGVRDNTGASTISTKPKTSTGTTITSRLQLWLPNLK